MFRILKYIGYALIVGMVLYLFSLGEVISLYATDNLPLGRNPALPTDGTNLVSTMKYGEDAQVLSCNDIKTDVVIKIRLRSGETGYVSSGNYYLKRKKASLMELITSFDHVTFSCKGMFKNRQYIH